MHAVWRVEHTKVVGTVPNLSCPGSDASHAEISCIFLRHYVRVA